MEESPEEIQRDLDRFQNDAIWLGEHREEFLKKYPEQWVAVYHKELVATARSVKGLVHKLERKGIPPGRVVHDFLTEEEFDLIV
jgi:hypothetical protein